MGSFCYFLYYHNLFFCLAFLFCFFVYGSSSCDQDFPIGNQVTLSIPAVYETGFQEQRFLFDAGGPLPSFKGALSVKASEGKFICFLEVLLGGLKVWSTNHLSKFVPTTKKCVLELTRDGDLQLKDSSGLVGWRSITLGRGVERLQLLRTGNLILTDEHNCTKWQSFDYPADIMLWSQKLSVEGQLITSVDNSTSFYSFEVKQDKISLYLNSGDRKYSYWELRPERDASSISFAQLGSTGLKAFGNSARKLLHIRSMTTEPIRFLALERSGTIALYYYSAPYGEFKASYRTFNELCDLPLPCGPYGICTYESSCQCMQFAGRQYSTSPNCDEGLADVFCQENGMAKQMVELHGVTSVLRPSAVNSDIAKEECVNMCLENCSCLAALYSDELSGLKQDCFHYGLVGGVRQASWGIGLTYWVKAPLETGAHAGHSSTLQNKILIIGGVLDGLGICLILGGLVYYFRVIRKKSENLGGGNN